MKIALSKHAIVFIVSFFGFISSLGDDYSLDSPNVEAKAAVLMDAHSGKILFEQNSEQPLPPASMSKMMSEYIVLEKVARGKLKWDEIVTVSENAALTEGSRIDLAPGEKMTVRDLYSAMAIASANNATVALAEHIASSEAAFTKLMNKKARQLGLSRGTHFINSTGLDEHGRESQMTAKDVAKLAYRLLHDYPEVLGTANIPRYKLERGGPRIRNTNLMLRTRREELQFAGVDGLKTGFTDGAGYCFTGTAKRGEKRVISVVMGTDSIKSRFIETKKLLSYGFHPLNFIALQANADS
ncbi:D-alanyl-D-alanine carboxypeptidase family protein [Numidum massiliense]|uniref:D-alanyl-D-alanine carboxypeptidase family protein n=1 Tax=Numidum massiliense TaxID=1522315 RepID=UPI0006D5A74D|nr:D-alanyl-D-alanine carboxypeptidase family protein [Numidum massiliense]